ncbi:MAG: hypothetical protein HC896_17820 [Bacteroidales bacterium]|nr:hypothetical protein [Bacteroidales bacterium]
MAITYSRYLNKQRANVELTRLNREITQKNLHLDELNVKLNTLLSNRSGCSA